MSQDQFGETTRRAFLGTATVATAATLTAPVAGEAQTADKVILSGRLNWRKRTWMFPLS